MKASTNPVFLCEVCHKSFEMTWEERRAKLIDGKQMSTIYESINGQIRTHDRHICDGCYQNNWKFTEHGVLMNETPVKKKGKK